MSKSPKAGKAAGDVFVSFVELPIITFSLVATMVGSGVFPWHQIHYSKSNRYVGVEDEALLTFFFRTEVKRKKARDVHKPWNYEAVHGSIERGVSDGRGSERCSDLPRGTAGRCSAARPSRGSANAVWSLTPAQVKGKRDM